ncbi:MAG: hypothetical protein AAF646_11615 [Pseudomonadota bacterium]
MPDAGKKQFNIKQVISPFGEVKGKAAPDWFDAIPGIHRHLAPVLITRKLMLDPRKWKQADIEKGIYAVARYELQIFATKLAQIEKKFAAGLPPAKGKRDWSAVAKSSAPQDKKLAKVAEEAVKKGWASIAKDIENKVSLALDEAEADKGDNKRALAAGKEAIKKFNNLDTRTMFSGPIGSLQDGVEIMRKGLAGGGGDSAAVAKEAQKKVVEAKNAYDRTAKEVGNVLKYMLDAGKKMEKDKNAHAKLQAVGKTIMKQSSALDRLNGAIDLLEKTIGAIEAFIKSKDPKATDAQTQASKLAKAQAGYDKILKAVIGTVADIAKEFNAASKEVKS